MARAKVDVDIDGLRKTITDLEKKNTYAGLTDLWRAVCESKWGKAQPKLTPSVVYLRVQEYKIPVKTKPGKRGSNATAEGMSKRLEGRKQSSGRAAKFKKFGETFAILRERFPEARWENLINRAERGSTAALIKLKCLDCSGGQVAEIKHCTCVGCPLYPVRPYQEKNVGAGVDSDELVEAS